jgi:hypothetical protein
MTKDFPHGEVCAAITAINRKLRAICRPELAHQMGRWICSLSPTDQPSGYFTQQAMFPMLWLPAWMAKSWDAWDQQFQSDLVYSTINGYYFIRLLDNVMDDHSTVERELLPMAAFFHSEFQGVYQRYFESAHPFWRSFDSLWIGSAEAVACEATLHDLDFAAFREVIVGKLSAAKVPMVAAHYFYGERSALKPWLQFSDSLAQWWQFLDDLMDWHADHQRGITTYFLCEAQRRKRGDESVHRWVAREGFQWGLETLTSWMTELHAMASYLACPEIQSFLEDRTFMLQAIAAEMMPGMQGLEHLALAMDGNLGR